MQRAQLSAFAMAALSLSGCGEGALAFRALEPPEGTRSVAWGVTRGAAVEVSMHDVGTPFEVDVQSAGTLSLRFFASSLEELGVEAGPLIPRSTEPVFGRLPAGLGDVVRVIKPGEDGEWISVERAELLEAFTSAELPPDPYACMELEVEALIGVPAGGLVTGVARESDETAILLVAREGRTSLHRLAREGEVWTLNPLEPPGFDAVSSSSVAAGGLEDGGVWLSSCRRQTRDVKTATVWSLTGDELEPIMGGPITHCPLELLPPSSSHPSLLLVNGFNRFVQWYEETNDGWRTTRSASIAGDRVLRGEGDTLFSVTPDTRVVYRLEGSGAEVEEAIEALPTDRLRGLMTSEWGPLLLTGEGGVFANARAFVRRSEGRWELLFSVYTQYWISSLPFQAGALLTGYSGLIRQLSLRDGYCVPDEGFSTGVWRGGELAPLDPYRVVVAGEAIADHEKHVVAVIRARSK